MGQVWDRYGTGMGQVRDQTGWNGELDNNRFIEIDFH